MNRAFPLPFREPAGREPDGRTAILGPAICDAERMRAYVGRRNPRAPDVAEAYLRIGGAYGVRGDVAFCQAARDTRAWLAPYEGPYGRSLLAEVWTGGLDAEETEAAIEAHIRCLYGFATDAPYPAGVGQEEGGCRHIRRRFEALRRKRWRGSAPHWEDLDGRWTGTPAGYGRQVVAMWLQMWEWSDAGERAGSEEPRRQSPEDGNADGDDGGGSVRTHADLIWLREHERPPALAALPDRKVSWAEAAKWVQNWARRSRPG